jgi:hypothetical protein
MSVWFREKMSIKDILQQLYLKKIVIKVVTSSLFCVDIRRYLSFLKGDLTFISI